MMATVAAGEWIRVRIPSANHRATMSIDGGAEQPVFIDREGPNIYAQVRAPDGLRRGRHRAVVTSDGITYNHQFEVGA